MRNYHMTPRGRQRLTDREGKRLVAYTDSKGIWTVGVGHAATSGRAPIPVRGMVITAQQCDDILTRDLAERYEPLLNAVLNVDLADHEFRRAALDYVQRRSVRTLDRDPVT